MSWILLCLIFLSTKIHSVESTCYSQESCLYEELFETVGYSNNVRPVLFASDQLTVNMTLFIRALGGIDEKNEVMTIVGYLSLEWYDNFLSWNITDPTYGGVEALVFFAEDIWLPDVAIVNSVDNYYKSTYKEDFRLNVLNDGHVIWQFGGNFKTTCSLDISNYPFDIQKCAIEVQNWAYIEPLVDLQFSENAIKTTNYEKNALWDITGVGTRRTLEPNSGYLVPRLTFEVEIERKTLYYMYNIIAPVALISVITLAMFWVPPGCGEKLGLGITVLLAFSVFQIIIMDNTPINSDVTPKITQVVVFVMAMATISILCSMLTVALDLQSSCTRLPRILRLLAFKILAKVFFLTAEIPDIPEENEVEPLENLDLPLSAKAVEIIKNEKMSSNDPKSEMGSVLAELKKITTYIKEKEHSESIVDEWKLFSKVIDRLLFWISLVTFLIYFINMGTAIASARK